MTADTGSARASEEIAAEGPLAELAGEGPPSLDRPEAAQVGLRRRVAHGTIVNAGFNIGINLLNLVRGFIVAAFLTRSDYGTWGLLFISLGTLAWLKQVGVGDKYIQQDETDQELAFQKAFTLELMVTGVFTLFLISMVPVLAALTHRPELIPPGIAIAMCFPAVFLQSPLWVYYRRMDFMRQRLLQAVDPVVGAVVTTGLAIAGAGYWSLVIGLVVGTWVGAIVAVLASPYRLRLRYERGTFREYRDFSVPLFVAAVASLVLPQGAVLIGQHAVGFAGVGAITLAATVSQFADRVDQIVTNTIYPAICAVRDRTDLLFESFVKSNRLALMWGMPFGVGLTLFAPDIVRFGIGEHWRPALGLIQVFGLMAAADQIGFNWDAYFRARAQTWPIAILSLVVMTVFITVTVPLLLTHGLNGFALGMAILTAVSVSVRAVFLTRLFPAFRMAVHAARAIAPTAPAIAFVVGARALETGGRSLAVVVIEGFGYVAVTAAATWILERALLREVAGYLRRETAQPQPAV
jgi:O-antigen/teichoic acid export membrane protein